MLKTWYCLNNVLRLLKLTYASKGVDVTRLKPEFFGETKPFATNDTPEGRQKNRRVEMKVIFE